MSNEFAVSHDYEIRLILWNEDGSVSSNDLCEEFPEGENPYYGVYCRHDDDGRGWYQEWIADFMYKEDAEAYVSFRKSQEGL